MAVGIGIRVELSAVIGGLGEINIIRIICIGQGKLLTVCRVFSYNNRIILYGDLHQSSLSTLILIEIIDSLSEWVTALRAELTSKI